MVASSSFVRSGRKADKSFACSVRCQSNQTARHRSALLGSGSASETRLDFAGLARAGALCAAQACSVQLRCTRLHRQCRQTALVLNRIAVCLSTANWLCQLRGDWKSRVVPAKVLGPRSPAPPFSVLFSDSAVPQVEGARMFIAPILWLSTTIDHPIIHHGTGKRYEQ